MWPSSSVVEPCLIPTVRGSIVGKFQLHKQNVTIGVVLELFHMVSNRGKRRLSFMLHNHNRNKKIIRVQSEDFK